ncbi:hypothetical protein LZ30DRAFT_79748 [Colletotrichum cereale]|nr:hypothetical protein LZ30DRAFT_79748 [Colletotrichum cereale]
MGCLCLNGLDMATYQNAHGQIPALVRLTCTRRIRPLQPSGPCPLCRHFDNTYFKTSTPAADLHMFFTDTDPDAGSVRCRSRSRSICREWFYLSSFLVSPPIRPPPALVDGPVHANPVGPTTPRAAQLDPTNEGAAPASAQTSYILPTRHSQLGSGTHKIRTMWCLPLPAAVCFRGSFFLLVRYLP